MPERQLRVDVAIDVAVGRDVVGAVVGDLHHPHPDVRIVVQSRCAADAFGDLRSGYTAGRIDTHLQIGDRQAADGWTADDQGVEADRHFAGR